MSLNDPLANALSMILNAIKVGKAECTIKPSSKLVRTVFDIMKKNNYVKNYKIIEDGKGNFIKLKLEGNINKCGVIKPRFSVKGKDFEKYEKRFLLAKDFGILIISTSKGIMTHTEAKEKNLGGRLIAYCY